MVDLRRSPWIKAGLDWTEARDHLPAESYHELY